MGFNLQLCRDPCHPTSFIHAPTFPVQERNGFVKKVKRGMAAACFDMTRLHA